MDKSKSLTITVSEKEIIEQLEAILTSENKSLIASVIVKNLQKSPVGISQLYKSLSGIAPKVDITIGQPVLIDIERMYSYKMDKEKTLKSDLMFQGFLPAEVTDIDLQADKCITVRFTALDEKGKKVMIIDYIKEDYCHSGEEYIPLEESEDEKPF